MNTFANAFTSGASPVNTFTNAFTKSVILWTSRERLMNAFARTCSWTVREQRCERAALAAVLIWNCLVWYYSSTDELIMSCEIPNLPSLNTRLLYLSTVIFKTITIITWGIYIIQRPCTGFQSNTSNMHTRLMASRRCFLQFLVIGVQWSKWSKHYPLPERELSITCESYVIVFSMDWTRLPHVFLC